MAEPGRTSALDGVPPAERAGSSLRLAERPGLALVHLAGRPARPGLLAAVGEALGVALPLEPNTATHSREVTAFWLAPGRWLIESEHLAANAIEDRLRAAPDAAGVAIADLSSGRTVIRVCGDGARHTLAQGCPIDLHPGAFPPGSIAHSVLEGISVMLHHLPDGSGFDLYVPRSYGESMLERLREEAGADQKPRSA